MRERIKQNKENIIDFHVNNYIKFVDENIKKFSEVGSLIDSNDEISPQRVNTAMAMLYDMALFINAEYQRQKINYSALKIEYQSWYDKKFIQAKRIVLEENAESKSAKPALKEYEVKLRTEWEDDYEEWTIRLEESEARMRFLLSMRDTISSYDRILTTLSSNMRTEMFKLSIDYNSNMIEENYNKNKLRTRFPK